MDSNTALQTVEEPARQTKGCSRCGEDKPVQEFGRDNSHADKLSRLCKECANKGRTEIAAGVKRCSVCGQVKPRSDFYVFRSRINRISSVCKDCIKAAREEIGGEMKICSKCGTKKPLYEFYADASRPDKHKGSCKMCWNTAMGSYPEDTVGDHVESQIISILRAMAESQYRLDEVEVCAGELRARQVVCREELTRVCTILRTDADPVKRQCDYGRIAYDDAGLSVTLEPEIAWLHRDEY